MFRRRRTTRRRPIRRRRSIKRRGKRNFQQRQVRAGIRMKYTRVFVPSWDEGSEVASGTISLAAGKGSSGGTYYSITDVNPDDKTRTDMNAYQQFAIYGVSCKWFFAEPTTVAASPVQLSLAYSPNELLNPNLNPDRMQSMSTFQTMPCNQNKSVNRYYSMGYTKKKLGIDYATTSTYGSFGASNVALYGGQLPATTGPSVHFKVYRNSIEQVTIPACRLQITFYVRFRGTKGLNSLT